MALGEKRINKYLSQCGLPCSRGALSQLVATMMIEMLKSEYFQYRLSKILPPLSTIFTVPDLYQDQPNAVDNDKHQLLHRWVR